MSIGNEHVDIEKMGEGWPGGGGGGGGGHTTNLITVHAMQGRRPSIAPAHDRKADKQGHRETAETRTASIRCDGAREARVQGWRVRLVGRVRRTGARQRAAAMCSLVGRLPGGAGDEGCHLPLGGHAEAEVNKLHTRAAAAVRGAQQAREEGRGPDTAGRQRPRPAGPTPRTCWRSLRNMICGRSARTLYSAGSWSYLSCSTISLSSIWILIMALRRGRAHEQLKQRRRRAGAPPPPPEKPEAASPQAHTPHLRAMPSHSGELKRPVLSEDSLRTSAKRFTVLLAAAKARGGGGGALH